MLQTTQIVCYFRGLRKEEIKALMNGKSKTATLIPATEVKICITSFQNVPPGMPPYVVVAARPQGNN
eukprot:3581553-Ditylum_brightwellii.AAC.1